MNFNTIDKKKLMFIPKMSMSPFDSPWSLKLIGTTSFAIALTSLRYRSWHMFQIHILFNVFFLPILKHYYYTNKLNFPSFHYEF